MVPKVKVDQGSDEKKKGVHTSDNRQGKDNRFAGRRTKTKVKNYGHIL